MEPSIWTGLSQVAQMVQDARISIAAGLVRLGSRQTTVNAPRLELLRLSYDRIDIRAAKA